MYNLTGSSIEQGILEHLFVYWVYSFILLRLYGYRFNPPIKTALVVLFNQCVISYLLLNTLPGSLSNPNITFESSLNRLSWMFIYIMTYYITHCFWFYWSHRLLHTRFFWTHVHYIHHIYRTTLPYATFYCHPIEHAMTNLMSVFIGPIILPCDTITLKIWIHIGVLHSLNAHFSEMRGDTPGTHDLHHTFYRFNYGTGAVMDKIYGTYMKPSKI